jgi:NADPH:quinone reductase-like Zn-dependent oxidoreductase
LLLCDLIEAAKVRPIVERIYSLSEAREALAHLGEGHARGKIVISV